MSKRQKRPRYSKLPGFFALWLAAIALGTLVVPVKLYATYKGIVVTVNAAPLVFDGLLVGALICLAIQTALFAILDQLNKRNKPTIAMKEEETA